MPAHERLRATGLQHADRITRQLGAEARDLRRAAGVSQATLAAAIHVSRGWVGDFELGRLRVLDLRTVAILFALLGQKMSVKAFPTGEPLRDAGQSRLLGRFNQRLASIWRRHLEAVMPISSDLRAWDELLVGPVSIGVDAETVLRDLQATERAMAAKLRDSGCDRMILLVAASDRNRSLIRTHIGALRQTFPLGTREVMTALAAGRDPGANGLVVL